MVTWSAVRADMSMHHMGYSGKRGFTSSLLGISQLEMGGVGGWGVFEQESSRWRGSMF